MWQKNAVAVYFLIVFVIINSLNKHSSWISNFSENPLWFRNPPYFCAFKVGKYGGYMWNTLKIFSQRSSNALQFSLMMSYSLKFQFVKSFSSVTQSTGAHRFDYSVWFSIYLPCCDVNLISAESVMSVSDVSPWGTPVFPIHMFSSSQTDDKLNYCPLLDTTFTIFCAQPYVIISLSTMNSTVHLSHKQTLFCFSASARGKKKKTCNL